MLLSAGCFETPVEERMEIVFDGDGTAIVRVDVALAEDAARPEMAQRLDAIRAEILDERDPWARRFESVHPKGESFTWEKSQGKLLHATRIARINQHDLGRLFFDTALQVSYTEIRGHAELSIFAGESQRASREQVRLWNETADGWSRAVARYYQAVGLLYRYAAAYPERAEALFAVVFESELAKEEFGELQASLNDEERVITDRVVAAIDDIVSAQTAGGELSADELARLVNDPFPADLLVKVDGEIDEIEGFARDPEGGGVRVVRKGLLEALDAMRSRWASPDPFHAMLDRWRLGDDAPPFDFDGFLAMPRNATPPEGWREVRAALDESLRPASTYRVRWQVKRRPN
ncbi:MAG: hypothetical protein ACSLFQ_11290 [Thermoanaerobaculia bacterium]